MTQSIQGQKWEKEMQDLYRSLPELPLPLTTLTDAGSMISMVNPFTIAQNKAIQKTGASKWQRPSMLTRRAEDFVRELLLRDAPRFVNDQTSKTVLEGMGTVLSAKVDREPWASIGHAQCVTGPKCEAWQEVSASSFFWGLFVDVHVNEDLDEKSMLEIGNAFLFAQWKEKVEYLALKALCSDCSPEMLSDKIAGYLNPNPSATGDFEKFVTQQMPAQTVAVNQMLTGRQIKDILETSPWCGLISVLDALKKSLGAFNTKTKEYPKRVRIASASLKAHVMQLWYAVHNDAGYTRCLACLSHERKRVHEHRFRLAVLVQCIIPKLPKALCDELASLRATALRLVTERDDFALSYNGVVSKDLDALSLQILKQTPSLEKMLDAQVPVLSHAAVDFLSYAWSDLWSRILENKGVRALVLVGLGSGGGFFLSRQRWLIGALASVVRLLMQELLPLLV